MKQNILKFTTLLLILAGFFSSCAKEETGIPFTEYSLPETGCWWVNFKSGKVTIVNSNKELERYINCSNDGKYPAIDFSKHTLLLAKGVTPVGVGYCIAKSLQQLSAGKYVLNIEVKLGDSHAPDIWHIALITSKLHGTSNIKLNVTTIK